MNFKLIVVFVVTAIEASATISNQVKPILGDMEVFQHDMVGKISRGLIGAKFDEKINEYFAENFKSSGILYLEDLKVRLNKSNLADHLHKTHIKDRKFLIDEMKAIVFGDRGRRMKSKDQVLYRIHRFLGLLDSVAGRLILAASSREVVDPENIFSLRNPALINYKLAFPDRERRHSIDNFIESEIKNALNTSGRKGIYFDIFALELAGFLPFQSAGINLETVFADIRGALGALRAIPSLMSAEISREDLDMLRSVFLNHSDPENRINLKKKFEKLRDYFAVMKKWENSTHRQPCKIPKFVESKRTEAKSTIVDSVNFVEKLGVNCGTECCSIGQSVSLFSQVEKFNCFFDGYDSCDSIQEYAFLIDLRSLIGLSSSIIPTGEIVPVTQNIDAFAHMKGAAKRFDTWVSRILFVKFGSAGIDFLKWIVGDRPVENAVRFNSSPAIVDSIGAELIFIVGEAEQNYNYRLHRFLSHLKFFFIDPKWNTLYTFTSGRLTSRSVEVGIHQTQQIATLLEASNNNHDLVLWALKFLAQNVILENELETFRQGFDIAGRVVSDWDLLKEQETMNVNEITTDLNGARVRLNMILSTLPK